MNHPECLRNEEVLSKLEVIHREEKQGRNVIDSESWRVELTVQGRMTNEHGVLTDETIFFGPKREKDPARFLEEGCSMDCGTKPLVFPEWRWKPIIHHRSGFLTLNPDDIELYRLEDQCRGKPVKGEAVYRHMIQQGRTPMNINALGFYLAHLDGIPRKLLQPTRGLPLRTVFPGTIFKNRLGYELAFSLTLSEETGLPDWGIELLDWEWGSDVAIALSVI